MPGHLTNSARKRAREARQALGLGLDDPLADILVAVEAAGVAVAILDLGDAVAGAYLSPTGRPVTFVNGRDAPQRMRFTLAHEFGHHWLGHGKVVDDPTALWGGSTDPHEVAANAFAAEFLMPPQATKLWAVRRARRPHTLETVVRFAVDFGVSAKAACIRLQTAGVLEDERLCERLHGEIDEGLHYDVAEALGDLVFLEDEIADAQRHLPRLPADLRHSAFGDLLSGRTDVDGLARRIGRDAAQVEAMLDAVGLAPLVAALR